MPRNPRPAAVRMMLLMSSVTRTTRLGTHNGATCRSTMRPGPAPASRAAAMKSVPTSPKRLRPRQPRVGRPGRERDGRDRAGHAGLQGGDERQRQDQPREGEEDVRHPHQHPVPHPARVAGDAPDREAHRRHHRHHGDDHPQRDPPAVEDARENVPPQLVGAEQVRRRGPRQPVGQLLVPRIVRGQHRRQHRPGDQHHDHRQPRHRQRVAPELQPQPVAPPPRRLPARRRGVRQQPGARRDHRTRGSSSRYIRSANRLRPT